MIWLNLLLFVVSFVITALLAPKPKFENARPQELKDVNFPQASENAPVALVLGQVRQDAPNTIWYGNFRAVPITKRVKTGLFKKKNIIIGHNYYMTLDLGLALGPRVVLSEILMDEEVLWSHLDSAADATIPHTGKTLVDRETLVGVSKPTLFGGVESGGGWTGRFRMYSGAFTNGTPGQIANAVMETLVGDDVPAYYGFSHIVFEDNWIGESASLRKMSFMLECYTNALVLTNSGKIGNDMNPAEAIYQIATDPWRGIGINPINLDLTSLVALGELCYEESNGVSLIITAENEGKDIIAEILRQVDAVAYQDPVSGKMIFKAIRNDYDVLDLPVYDEDSIIKFKMITKTTWENVFGQVKVSYANRHKDDEKVAVAQDTGVIAMTGKVRSTSVSFPLCYSDDTANELAARELSQLSVPLFNGRLEMNRNAYSLRPGDAFVINWPRYGLLDTVFRVKSFDLGEMLDGRIVIDILQDNFGVPIPVFNPPVDTEWEEPGFDPVVPDDFSLVEMPYKFSSRIENPLSDGFVGYIPFVAPPGRTAAQSVDVMALISGNLVSSRNSSGYGIAMGYVSGTYETEDPIVSEYYGSGLLVAELNRMDGFQDGFVTGEAFNLSNVQGKIPFTTYRDIPLTNVPVGLIRSGNFLLWANGEWMAYTNFVIVGSNWRFSGVYRGLLGSSPKTHPIGTQVFVFDSEMLMDGTFDNLEEGDTLYYKILDSIAGVATAPRDAPEQTTVAGTLANRPVRPTFLRINDVRTGIDVLDFVNRNLTWNTRNRGNSLVDVENDDSVTPDQSETYNVDVFINNVRNTTLSEDGVTSPYAIPFSSVNLTSTNCEIRVTSQRTGGNTRESAEYAFIRFTIDQRERMILSGDAQSGTDRILVSGDAQSGTDTIIVSGS